MKLDDSFEMRVIGGQNIIVPAKIKNVDFTHILTLNESAVVIWNRMTQGEFEEKDLVDALMAEYDVTEEKATSDVKEFVENLKKLQILS